MALGYSIADRIRDFVAAPETFFERVRGDPVYLPLLILLGTALLTTLFSPFTYLSGISPFLSGGFGFYLFPLVLFGIGFLFIALLLYAVFVFTFAKGFGGALTYGNAVKAAAYSLIPVELLSIIPLVGIFGLIYFAILMTFAVKKLGNLSTGKAAAAALLPVLILFLILVGLVGFVILSFAG
jgi:hypothetical protein